MPALLVPMGIWGEVMVLEGPHRPHPLQPEYKYVDPICTFLFSALVLGTTLTILRDVLLVLMEGRDPLEGSLGCGVTHGCRGPRPCSSCGSASAGTPKGMDFNAVQETLLAVRGVEAVHSLHIWALTAAQPLLSVHIAISECHNAGRGGSGFPRTPTSPNFPLADAAASAQEVLEEASSRLQGAFRFHTTTIQVESYSEEMRDCRECQPPPD